MYPPHHHHNYHLLANPSPTHTHTPGSGIWNCVGSATQDDGELVEKWLQEEKQRCKNLTLGSMWGTFPRTLFVKCVKTRVECSRFSQGLTLLVNGWSAALLM